MRPVEKGESNSTYKEYQDARDDLRDRICFYCSYCEMPIYNMPAIEHVVPRKNGGDEVDWQNFLFSCWYCNSNKSNDNLMRTGYLWPDMDNTFRAFKYEYAKTISVDENLTQLQQTYAKATIDLFKLNREPGSTSNWKYKDTRWFSRKEAWDMALESMNDWLEAPSERMAKAIARTAKAKGHFSIWMEVFKEHKNIKCLIIEYFKGTAKDCFDQEGNPIQRVGGNI